jgi:uncharacterized DUF497 family protein
MNQQEEAQTIASTLGIDASRARFGEVNGVVVFVIYTWRENNRRIISARKAGIHERERYYAQVAARGTVDEQ